MSQVAAFCIAMNTKISLTPQRDKKPRKRFYICDRTRCEHCSDECRHTTDLKYAQYPEHDDFVLARDGSMWQQVKHHGS